MRNLLKFFLFFALVCGSAGAQSVAPIQGLGQIQFFSNTGAPLTNGVLYSYVAGTTTQQATYTDATGLTQNPNPITFSIGARASVWLTIGSFYKFVLCSQNDGPACAPGDTIYSVDQVPGGSSGSSGGSSPFTGIFISQTASPASSGILRLASGDSICWRNQAGTTNLCIRKNANDLLQWDGSSLGFAETTSICGQAATGVDLLWADNAAHRWLMSNNGGGCNNVVASGVDINTSDQVTQLHFGATAAPICGTAPTSGQFIQWNGTQLCGTTGPETTTWVIVNNGNDPCPTVAPASTFACNFFFLTNAHTLTRITANMTQAPSGCSPNATYGLYDMTAAAVVSVVTPTGLGPFDSGALSAAMTAGHRFVIGQIGSYAGCATPPIASVSVTFQ